MRVFDVQEFHQYADDLSREAQDGRLAMMSRDGRPMFICVPLTGVHVELAVHLFRTGEFTSAHAAKLAGMSQRHFLAHLASHGNRIADGNANDLAQELTSFGKPH